jgi:hypothetical protein
MLGWKKQALRRTDDSKDRVLCHSLAPQMADRNRSVGPVLRFSKGSKGCFVDLESSHFSLSKG